jgi:hypothetical protein
MKFKETIERIQKENLLIKEIFYTKGVVYECVNKDLVKVFTISKHQYNNISKVFNTIVQKEDYNGFTKRYYKVIF